MGKEGLHELVSDIPSGKIMAQQPVMQNRVEQGLLSTSDVVQADSIELQEIMEDAARSTDDLTSQLDNPQGDSLVHPLCKLLGMEKELRSIRVR